MMCLNIRDRKYIFSTRKLLFFYLFLRILIIWCSECGRRKILIRLCCRCQYCSKTFTRKEHMVNHVRKHTGETPHRCDICKKSFTRKEHFMNHVMWHTGETPHHCQACGKKYTRKEHLANHMRSHTNDTPFRCEICGEWCNFIFLYLSMQN